MPLSVEQAFDSFLIELRNSKAETTAAALHRASIKAKLEAVFGMTSFFRTGSFGNGTSLSGYSDVDYFAVIPRLKLKKDSSVSLSEVAQALRDRFPNTLNIRVDAPGVKIPFGLDGAEATEIVPVDATGTTTLGFRSFDMPDGVGGWKFSSPESHNAYVNAIDKKHDGRVKPLIRFVKAWKSKRDVPIRSFYLEMFVAQYADSENSIIYDLDIQRILYRLHQNQLADLLDVRFSDVQMYFSACSTDLRRKDALSKLGNALTWATDAADHRRNGRVKEAFGRWDLVFNYSFPSYGIF